jgi:hypothetical protein
MKIQGPARLAAGLFFSRVEHQLAQAASCRQREIDIGFGK